MKRLVSCSKCFKAVEPKFTTMKDGLRICHECKHQAKIEGNKPFVFK